MSQISRHIIQGNVAERIFEVFFKSLVELGTKKEAEEFTQSLFTPTERVMLAKRLAIAFLLEKGYTYRTIQKVLNVSLSTIGFVNFVRQYDNPTGYKKVLGKIIRDEKLSGIFENIVKGIATLPATGGKGSGAWRSLKFEMEKTQRKRNAL